MGPARAAPAYVQLFPTLRCTRACGFCFNRGLPGGADMSPGLFVAILDRTGAAGVTAVDLLGGEPTLHPRLGELVAAVAARGMRATISTNGDCGPEALERLEDAAGPGALRIGVSVNEERIPEALEDYLARRSPMVKSVCSRARGLPAPLLRHLDRRGADGFLIFRDAVAPGDLEDTVSYPVFLEKLAAARRRHPGLAGVACGGFVPDLERSPELAGARCPAGTTKLSVMPDGSTYPCYLLFGRPEFRLGNLASDPFARIWGSRVLERFRAFRGNPCRVAACPRHAACRGGCPAVSLLVAGDMEAPDPRCSAA